MQALFALVVLTDLYVSQAAAGLRSGPPRAAARAPASTAPRGALTSVRADDRPTSDATSERLRSIEMAVAMASVAGAAARRPVARRVEVAESAKRQFSKEDSARLEWVFLSLLRLFAIASLLAHALAGELDAAHCLPSLCILLLARAPRQGGGA